MSRFPYNPPKCSSASSLSGCIHWFLSKTIIALPTKAEIVELFEKTLIGGFSCVNTNLSFDSKILLRKDEENTPNQKFKLIYKIKSELSNKFENKKIVRKIIKMDENNQYGYAMTKPLPTGSIKKMKRAPTLREFELILQSISNTDKIGHLVLVDIEFDRKNATEKQIFFNEIYTPIFEQKKVLCANERLVFQLYIQCD